MITTRSSAFIRGEGGWGGDRGPSSPQNVPPDRAPDHEVTYETRPDQARFEAGVKLALVQSDVYQAFLDLADSGNASRAALSSG